MPPGETISLQKQLDIYQLRNQVKEDLAAEHVWDKDQYQTIEENQAAIHNKMVNASVERNKKLQKKAQTTLPPAEAAILKDEEEISQIKKAEKSEKKHFINNARKREAARRQSDIADESSYDMHVAMTDSVQCHINAVHDIHQSVEREDSKFSKEIDWRSLRAFSHGYRLNSEKKPATAEDVQAKKDDDQMINDWVEGSRVKTDPVTGEIKNGDLEKRRPYLKSFTEWMLNVDMRPAMESDYYLRKNLPEVESICERIYCMNNLMNDPINKPFFDGLSKDEKDILDIRFQQSSALSIVVTSKAKCKGVSANDGVYVKGFDAEAVREEKAGLKAYKDQLKVDLEGEDVYHYARRKESEIFTSQVDRMAQEHIDRHRNIDLFPEADEETKRRMVTFRTPVSDRAFRRMDRARGLFYDNPENYYPNKELLQNIYHKMYEVCELYGQTALKREAYQSVRKEDGTKYAADKLKEVAATKAIEQFRVEREYYLELRSYYNALSFYLRGSKLQDGGRKVLEEFGVDKKMISAERKRKAQAAREKQ